MDFIKGAPCDFPMHLEDQAEVIDDWLQSLKCTERQRKRVLSCLGETYLRKLPGVGKSRPWPKNPVPKNYRYHFRAQISKVLGWKERTKFPEHIDALIREQLWPEHGEPDECKGGQQGSGGSTVRPSQPRNTSAGQEANFSTCRAGLTRCRERASEPVRIVTEESPAVVGTTTTKSALRCHAQGSGDSTGRTTTFGEAEHSIGKRERANSRRGSGSGSPDEGQGRKRQFTASARDRCSL